MHIHTRLAVSTAAAGVLVAALAGCSSSGSGAGTTASSGTASSSGTSSAAPSATPSVSPTPLAVITKLTGVHTQVQLDAGFLDALKTLKLTPGTVGSATLSNGNLTFPITGGDVTYYDPASGVRPYVTGEIDHQGSGISLTAGSTKVELKNFVIDPGNDSHLSGEVDLNGKVVAQSANLFRLDGTTLMPLTKDSDGDAILQGTTVYVSSDAAALLNKTFNTTAVTDQLKVGVAKITAKG